MRHHDAVRIASHHQPGDVLSERPHPVGIQMTSGEPVPVLDDDLAEGCVAAGQLHQRLAAERGNQPARLGVGLHGDRAAGTHEADHGVIRRARCRR